MGKAYNYLIEVDADVTILVDVLAESFDEACAQAKERAVKSLRINETKLCRLLSKKLARYESDVKILRDWEEYMIRYPISVRIAVLVNGVDEDHACSNAEEMVRRAIEIDYPCVLAELEVTGFTHHNWSNHAVAA